MRKIKKLIIHCSASPTNTTISSIKRYWREVLKWKNVGYHIIIEFNGNIVFLDEFENVVNGCKGHNYDSISVATIGGIDEHGKPKDNRSPAQIRSLIRVIDAIYEDYPDITLVSHHTLNPNKACPSYSAESFWAGVLLGRSISKN